MMMHELFFIHRLEHNVQRFELENSISVRWEPHMEEYKEAMKIVTKVEQQKIKEQMRTTAKERTFYLTTLVHHAGKDLCFHSHVRVFNMLLSP